MLLNVMARDSDLLGSIAFGRGALKLNNVVGKHFGFLGLLLIESVININLNLIMRNLSQA